MDVVVDNDGADHDDVGGSDDDADNIDDFHEDADDTDDVDDEEDEFSDIGDEGTTSEELTKSSLALFPTKAQLPLKESQKIALQPLFAERCLRSLQKRFLAKS